MRSKPFQDQKHTDVPGQLDPDICYRAMLTRDSRFDGRIFMAVRTTGIYCRPICPTPPPKREKCSRYPSAATAQGEGYRPCLRCRPELAPGGDRLACGELVRRVMAIMEETLDGGAVAIAARKLGVSTRSRDSSTRGMDHQYEEDAQDLQRVRSTAA